MSDNIENGTIADIPDEKLLRRAVMNLRGDEFKRTRSSLVMRAFGIGSTYASQLCRRFGLDPDEVVKR